MAMNYTPAVPAGMVLPQPVSTSKAIYRKTLIEMQPTEQSEYKPDAYNLVRWNIASNTDYCLFRESYFRWRITRNWGSAVMDNLAGFDVGGVHCLFKNIEVRDLQTGSLIQRYDDYNRWICAKKLLMESPEYVRNSQAPSGDAMFATGTSDAVGVPFSLAVTSAGSSLNAAGEVVLVGADYLGRLHVGDWVQFTVNKPTAAVDDVISSFMVSVESITSATAFTVVNNADLVFATNELVGIDVFPQGYNPSERTTKLRTSGTATTNYQYVYFKPEISFFDLDVPLFVFNGGIEIRFELELGVRAMLSGVDVTSSLTTQPYIISQPRFMAMMVTPHKDIRDEIVNKFRSPAGLMFSIPGVRTRRQGFGKEEAGDVVINQHFGVRSARYVISMITDSIISEGSSAITAANNSLSLGLRSSTRSFQYKIGAHEFPHREVLLDDDSEEAYVQTVNMFKHMSSNGLRLRPSDWRTLEKNRIRLAASTATPAIEKHFMFCADLSRDNGPHSEMTGSDLSVTPLDLELKGRTQAHLTDFLFTGTPVVYMFVLHDQVLRLGSEAIVVSS